MIQLPLERNEIKLMATKLMMTFPAQSVTNRAVFLQQVGKEFYR